jgi:hypothetical protein
MGGDAPSFAAVEAALAAVQKTLDRLTALGHDAQAFELARAQFAASLRSSWPGNLSTLTSHLERVAKDTTLALTADERRDLETAIAVLSSVKHP